MTEDTKWQLTKEKGINKRYKQKKMYAYVNTCGRIQPAINRIQ